MHTIAELQVFVRTAQHGSLSAAARSLGMLVATASAALRRLEDQLGCRLFERSTRSMRLTPQGEAFFEHCREALSLLEQGAALLNEQGGRVGGLLRISAPSDFGRNVLAGWIDAFQAQHPRLKVSLQCSDRFVDVFRDPYDMTFRYGRLPDASYVTQNLGANRRIVVAAPSYLARHGIPATPDDLARHNCLLHNLDPLATNTWRFRAGRRAVECKVSGDRISDDGAIVHAWAVGGAGIAYKSALDVHEDLRAGRLVRLLPRLTGEDWPLRAVFPHRASVAPAARLLAAFVRERIAELDLARLVERPPRGRATGSVSAG